MHNSAMKNWLETSWMAGDNKLWIEHLYNNFLIDSHSVDPTWFSVFKNISTLKDLNQGLPKNHEHNINVPTQIRLIQLIDSFRYHGHQQANLDPLGLWRPDDIVPNNLDSQFYNLTEDDAHTWFNVDDFTFNQYKAMTGAEIYETLKKTYCGSIGIEYMHLSNLKEKMWIQHYIESSGGARIFTPREKIMFLQDLTSAEGIELYLGNKFPGSKRFSLEGGDSLLPMMKEIVRYAAKRCISDIVFGMAHRGRLNALVNIFGKKTKDLLDEFGGGKNKFYGSGDVKYHMGYTSNIKTKNGRKIHLVLKCNPSHLEIINPVVMGSVRALLDRINEKRDLYPVLPITIHGDAAIIGQGIMQETLNMSKLRGYEVGGTIRIVINNQIGFTTSVKEGRTSQYCTDIGKMIQAPILHVNADDIEASIFATRLALNYRTLFKRDVFIDLVCYRRHGHNEADEPRATQPVMYQIIQNHPTSRKIYVDKLIQEQVISRKEAQNMLDQYRASLEQGECVVAEICKDKKIVQNHPFFHQEELDNEEKNLELDIMKLKTLAKCITLVPNYIKMHPRVAKIYQARSEMAEDQRPFDWSTAENLAYATLVDKGIDIRITGEDVGRGTFFQRHAVIHNQINDNTYIPLQHIHPQQGDFKIWNSVLSEEAALAFEYGYAATNPNHLTIWEAQFGDFANGAQVVIDQFISSGEQKWGQRCGLVMLLPHGYEGQGPEHSSARLERYLQLCAEQNMQVCIPTTPAQIYNLLCRQALLCSIRPLIIMSPKSLLRHPLATSALNELAQGKFKLAIDEVEKSIIPSNVKRIILCCGKIYYDLVEQRRKNKQLDIVIIRIEQLYPFPKKIVQRILQNYLQVRDFVWCQEEPLNQGSWSYIQPYIQEVIGLGSFCKYAGRVASASPAVGYMYVHQQQQQAVLNKALSIDYD
ncbi:MAG: 2-oxoglutarate dehydrogenase E1 component [Candidatus Dasytiphilus stammeri]